MATKRIVNRDYVRNFLKQSELLSKYHIEYNGFLSNHLAHAVVALGEIEADEAYFMQYVDHYVKKLEPAAGTTTSTTAEKELTVDELLGQRSNFPKLMKHYTTLYHDTHESNLEKFVAHEFPKISSGFAGAAFHPLIHVGYGLRVNVPEVVIQGIAYGHFAYSPPKFNELSLNEKIGNGSKNFVQVIEEARMNDELFTSMNENYPDKMRIIGSNKAGFQGKFMAVMDHGDVLISYGRSIKKPAGVNDEDTEKWLLDQAISLYLGAETRNDFFLLHGVTATWALKQVTPLLGQEDRQRSLSSIVCALFATYFAQGRPRLVKEHLDTPDVSAITWDDLRVRMLSANVADRDEHDLKLFQVCRDQCTNDPTLEDIYKRAVLNNLNYPFKF